MAYLHQNFLLHRDPLDLPVELAELDSPAKRSGLSALERSVVRLSMRDARSSLSALSLWRAGVRRVLGLPQANVLADPRLEALRRFAILLRVEGEVGQEEYNHFLAAGYDPAHAGQVAAMIGGAARHGRKGAVRAIGWIASLGVAGGLFAITSACADDPLMGVTVSALGFAIVLPFAGRA